MTKADGSRARVKFEKSLAVIKVATSMGQGDPYLARKASGSAHAPQGIAPSASTSGSVGGSFTGMTRAVALLRGVNVGGRNQLPMADLRLVLEGLGYGDVSTIQQSGNAVFEANARELRSAATDIERALGDELGLDIRVVTRSATELAAAVAADPLRAVATDPAKHFIGFLGAEPAPEGIAALLEIALGSDRVAVIGKHSYLWCPSGLSKSPLFKFAWDRRFRTSVTLRNVSTVAKIQDRL